MTNNNDWKMRFLAAIILLLALASDSITLRAASVTLENGNVIEGTIVTSTSENLSLRTDKGILTIRQKQVAHLDDRSEINDESRLQWSSTNRLKMLPLVTPEQMTDFDTEMIRNSTQILDECRTATTGTIAQFDTYLKNHKTTAPQELFLMCAECWYLAGDLESMVAQLEDLLKVFPQSISSTSETQKWAVDNTMDCLKQALRNGNADLGVRCLFLLSELRNEKLPIDTKLLRLAEVSAKKRRGQYVEAMRILINYIAPGDTDLAFVEGRSILNIMSEQKATDEDRLRALSYFCPVYVDTENAHKALAYFSDYISLLIKNKRFAEAMKLADRMESLKATDAQMIRKRIMLAQKLDTVPQDDAQTRYLLAGKAKEEGLIDDAIEMYQELLNDPDAKENAALQLELIQQEKEKKVFDVIKLSMEKGEYPRVIKQSSEFIRSYPRSEFRQQAFAQIELARFRMKQQESAKPAQAEVLMQNAERAYFEQNYDLASSLLVEIEADYDSTPAAERARDLRKRINGGYVAAGSGDKDEEKKQLAETMSSRAAYLGAIRAAYDRLEMSLQK